ncbi:MAG: DUF2934 domain-containing protein [Betaproteobacteria bacterium]|nr:DUF2934 domain-containing protein [Betaproteobacteria bacterium]
MANRTAQTTARGTQGKGSAAPRVEKPSPAKKPAVRPRAPAGKNAVAEAAARSAERQRMIAEAAYYRAERRGFAPGGEAEDWYAAEAEIDVRFTTR